MPNLSWPWIEAGIDLMEMLITCFFALRLFGSFGQNRHIIRITMLITSFAGAVMQYAADLLNLPVVSLLPPILVFFFCAACVLHTPKIQAAVWAILNCLMLGVCTMVVSSAVSLLTGTAPEILFENSGYRLIFLVINKLVQLLFSEIIVRVFRRKELIQTGGENIAILIVPVVSIAVLAMVWEVDGTFSQDKELYYILLMCALVVFLNIFMLFFHVFSQRSNREKAEAVAHAKVAQTQLRDQKEISEMYQSVRTMRHDMNNHLSTIHGLLAMKKYEEADAYLQNITDNIRAFDDCRTGVLSLDALMGSKTNYARSNHIQVNMNANVPRDLRIAEDDLSTLVGNLYNNAIDACLKIEDESKRRIQIDLYQEGDYLFIDMKNATNGDEKRIRGLWMTMKPNAANHGFGLKSIDRIVDKYNGFCLREHENNTFHCQIRLMNSEENF